MKRQKQANITRPESQHEDGPDAAAWYGQVARMTLAIGTVAVGAGATNAAGAVVTHTLNAPILNVGSGQQQMLYFDLASGNTYAGPVGASSVGLSTMDANPQANYRFGLVRVGPNWVGLYGRAANHSVPAINNEAMGTGAPVTWWPTAPAGTWQQANYVRPFQLAANALIGPGGQFYSAPARTYMGATLASGVNVQTMAAPWGGFWSPGTDGYLGLRFSPDNDGTNYNYGWIHLSIDSNSNMSIVSMAYETELNTGIRAGQMVAIPEPATTSLLLLGAAGLGSFRSLKKRKTRSTANTAP